MSSYEISMWEISKSQHARKTTKTAKLIFAFYTMTHVPSPCCQFTLVWHSEIIDLIGIGTNIDWRGVTSV